MARTTGSPSVPAGGQGLSLSAPTPGGMFQHGPCLLLRHSGEELHKFHQGHSVLQIFEERCNRDPSAAEHPGTTHIRRPADRAPPSYSAHAAVAGG